MYSRQSDKESRTEISPTGAGYMLILMLSAMLLASINYGNNMAYILCFLLIGLMMIGYLATRNNLKDLEISNVLSQPAFAGDTMEITFELLNQTRGRRVLIFPSRFGLSGSSPFTGPYSVDPFSRSTAKIEVNTERRGRYKMQFITLQSLYPLGLFQARRRIAVDKVYIVYPKPMGSMHWPEPEIHEADYSDGFYLRGGDDFVGIRPYRPGESMHHVDWKAVARGRPLSIKEFSGGGCSQLWFNWSQLEGMALEPRISQLTRWVLEADQEGKEFGLRLPDNEIPLDTSPGHTVKCLESLAVYKNIVKNPNEDNKNRKS